MSRTTPLSVMVGDTERQHGYLQACGSILGEVVFQSWGVGILRVQGKRNRNRRLNAVVISQVNIITGEKGASSEVGKDQG